MGHPLHWKSASIGIAVTPRGPYSSSSIRKPRRNSVISLLLSAFCIGGFLWFNADQLTSNPLSASGHHSRPLSYSEGVPSNLSSAHALHLVIPVSTPDANLCKSILSLNVLRYPPPTLLNIQSRSRLSGDESATKVRALHNWLQQRDALRDEDIILMVDGRDTWFQLPPNIMIARFKTLLGQLNENLRSRYGTVTSDGTARHGRYTEKILFGADKLCWQSGDTQHALGCSAIPESSLPDDSWGASTDKDSTGAQNRPRYLNSGTMIGRVGHVRELYDYAMTKAGERTGTRGDQYILSEIFGEQEYQRESARQEHPTPWFDWLSNNIGSFRPTNITGLHMDTVPGRNYEFGIGVDYSSQLFFTMTHAHQDTEWIQYNDTAALANLQVRHGLPHPKSVVMPLDLQRARSPFSFPPDSIHHDTDQTGLDLELPDPTYNDWTNLPLAINVHSRKVSPVLHFNGEKSYLDTWWPRMWYHPYAKPLLQKAIENPPALLAKERSLFSRIGGDEPESFWSTVTAAGGAWTDDGEWLSWDSLCGAYEDEIFGVPRSERMVIRTEFNA